MFGVFYNWNGFNKSLFIAVNQLTNVSIIPDILQAISSVFFIANFAVGYAITCIYFYFKTKQVTDKETYFITIYNGLVRIGICYALFGLAFAALKFSVNLPRPFCSLKPGEFITIANIASERCLSSFPSAHTGLSILVAYALWPYLNNFFKTLACFIIFAVAISRFTLAMHYPADILYSAVVTLLVIITGNFIFYSLHKKLIKPIGYLIFQLIFTTKKNIF